MKSTGEAIGYDRQLHRAAYKALTASGLHLRNWGTVLVSVADEDKDETIPLIQNGDGITIRRCAAMNSVTMLTSLDTVRMVLDVLEEITFGISTIDAE